MPITVGIAFLVFWSYNLDIVYDLLVALEYSVVKGVGGQVLTAFLIAGGSEGILEIFRKLKIREERDDREERIGTLQAQERQRSKKGERKEN